MATARGNWCLILWGLLRRFIKWVSELFTQGAKTRSISSIPLWSRGNLTDLEFPVSTLLIHDCQEDWFPIEATKEWTKRVSNNIKIWNLFGQRYQWWAEQWFPQKHPEASQRQLVPVPLYGKRHFADVIKMWRLSWVIWVETKCNRQGPYKRKSRVFPGGPGTKTLCSQCRGPRFNPWSGN